ncbi:MAG TPA: hypothetical protein VHP14_18590, partial [Anaerolineales bacterium]|nr:hypothetical protein [Anaerolineales bacterium]
MISQLSSFFKIYGKVFGLLGTMAVGAFFPQVHVLSFLIQYLLMVMLFFAFLDIEFKPETFQKSVIWVLLANVGVAFASYAVVAPFDTTFALAAFMTAIAPTATAAPVLTSFIQGKIEYVITAVLFTNVSIAVIVPVALPFLLSGDIHISIWQVLQPVLIVMFVPLILARLTSRLPVGTQTFIRKGKRFSFVIWLTNLFIVAANTSNFLRTENSSSAVTLISIALMSGVLCAVNFGVGALLGGRQNWQEASQSLGQKNISFV